MIDFHNHIIPNLDDGSKSIEMSLNMLREAERQGITDVVNTVHFQHPKMDQKKTSYDFVISKISNLQSILEKEKINIKIHAASEVFFKFNLTEILDNPITTFGNSKYMLIEFQRLSFPKKYEDEIFKLQLKNIIPIIAHPERYRFVQNDISIVKKWINKDYFIQLNAGSIMGFSGKMMQKTAFKLLKNEYCHLIGSDAHDNQNRNFCLKESLDKIERKFGSDFVEIINQNSTKLLNGEDLIPIKSLIKKKYWFF